MSPTSYQTALPRVVNVILVLPAAEVKRAVILMFRLDFLIPRRCETRLPFSERSGYNARCLWAVAPEFEVGKVAYPATAHRFIPP